jgi:transglutaminase-like putative cysteine protease
MENPVLISKSTRWWDWSAVLLLAGALIIAAIRLNSTGWTHELDLIQTVVVLGVIAGLALGKSSFSRGVARFFALVYGLFVIGWQVGLTLGKGVLWPERMISMGNRLLITLDQIFQQQPVTDNLFFNLLMASLFWALAVYAGYSLTRYGNAWRAILPTGIALIIIQAYDHFFPVRTWFLAGFIFLALLLVARLHFVQLQLRWKNNGTYLPPYVGLDSLRLGLITTVILVLFAWTAPAVASAVPQAEQVWLNATRPWMDVRNRLSNVFYSLQASVGVVSDFYGDYLPLGRGNPLSDTVIMTVDSQTRAPSNVRYYWRSRVYDTYDGSWSSSLPVVQSVSPDNFDLNFPEYESRETSTFNITTAFPIQNVHTPSQPIWISRPADAYMAVNSDGSVDLGHLKADPILRSGDTYQVEASLTAASVSELREAGTDYPSWVTARYLQLPDSITPRTHELAEEIAFRLDNPYDITQAITNFLRTNLDYNDTVPASPDGQEPIDWVLFDHKQAFCNYYATAEIIMLRSLGIPARLAVGYAEGERQSIGAVEDIPTLQPGGENIPQDIESEGDIFYVRHQDAHAWPEVYFPNIGWVEFEPTVSQQPIIRPIGNLPESSSDNTSNTLQDDLQDRARRRLEELSAASGLNQNASLNNSLMIPTAFWIALLSILVLLLAILIRRVRIQRGSPPLPIQMEASLVRVGIKPPKILYSWARYSGLSPLTRAYLELNRALSRLGQPPKLTDTPSERAKELVYLLPPAEGAVQAVLIPYQNSVYGNQTADPENAKNAGKEIRRLSFIARLKRFLARFQEPKNR